MNGFVVVIPARYASERLPGKPLREIAGKPMLQHVFERASESAASEVVIATDDQRIADAAAGFGAPALMTDRAHRSGTDRIAQVARMRHWPDEQVIVNVQGDEPLMPPALIDLCAELLDDPGADLATLASPFASRDDFDNPNVVKVVTDGTGFSLYFSRAAIPFARSPNAAGMAMDAALHHHGIYAYRNRQLQRIVESPQSAPEQAEQLEQLRALDIGLRIKVGIPPVRPGPGVDTEEDLAMAEAALAASG